MVKKTAVRELGIAWNKRELELVRRLNIILAYYGDSMSPALRTELVNLLA